MQGQRGVAHGGSRRQHLRMICNRGAVDLRHRLAQLLARRGNVRARRGHRIARMREFFGGNGAVRDQAAAALQVIVGGAFGLFALRDLRPQFLALCEQAAHLAYRARQIRFRVLFGDFRIRRVELEQRLAGLDELGVVHIERQDGARDFAGHLHHIAVHIAIIGAFEIPAVKKPVAPIAQGAQQHHRAQAEQPQASRAIGGRLRTRCGRRRSAAARSLRRSLRRLMRRPLAKSVWNRWRSWCYPCQNLSGIRCHTST